MFPECAASDGIQLRPFTSSWRHYMQMVPFTRRLLPLAFGVAGFWFAAERWLWFHNLPRYASARFCGNCFLGVVFLPTELALLGLLMAASSMLKIPDGSAAACGAVGVLLTPILVGIPLLACAALTQIVAITRSDQACHQVRSALAASAGGTSERLEIPATLCTSERHDNVRWGTRWMIRSS